MLHKTKSFQLVLLASAAAATVYAVVPWVKGSPNRADDAHIGSVSANRARDPAPKANRNGTAPNREVFHGPSGSSRSVPDSKGDAFINLSWVPAASPAVLAPTQVLPTPAPAAPPLPFTFVGLLEKGVDHPMAFVAKGDVLLVVAAGQTIDDNNYRVETLSAQKIVVTYLPMGIQQTLNIIGTSP